MVATIRTGSCKEKRAMHLRRCLAFVEAVRSGTIGADQIKGVDNVVADALSRDKLEVARSYMQAPEERLTKIPEGLVEPRTTLGQRRSGSTVLASISSGNEGTLPESLGEVRGVVQRVGRATTACYRRESHRVRGDPGMRRSEVRHHLAGLRQAHLRAGLSAPNWGGMARLGQIRKGLSRFRATQEDSGLARDPVGDGITWRP